MRPAARAIRERRTVRGPLAISIGPRALFWPGRFHILAPIWQVPVFLCAKQGLSLRCQQRSAGTSLLDKSRQLDLPSARSTSIHSLEDKQVKPFYEIQASDLDARSLQNAIDLRGYVLIRSLLPQDTLRQALSDITRILYSAQWLMRDDDPIQRIADSGAACGDPDPSFKRTYQDVFNLESFHALPQHPALRQVMRKLVGDNVLIHPKPIGRLIFPHCERLVNHAHQDFRFMNGDPECFTAWIPLHDCPASLGPLRILEGSHRFGVQNHDHENLHVPKIPEGAAQGGDWVGGDVNAGDVLIFHSLTVHGASPNVSNQIRISLDCRFQDCARVINPAILAFAGESGKSWEKTYADWRSNDLKFYWKKLPLRFSPSPAELKQLARTADSPRKRARYVRMLTQLEEFAECAS
jgi:ectoine hydroxylase-related dioxygenase (phytanoyl-CoA dioxygenase family)